MLRIASLLPSATELVCDLGLQDQLVAVSHCCDRPVGIDRLPVLTRSIIPSDVSPAEIDRLVSEAVRAGRALYGVKAELLDELRPDLVVTQGVCEVCAVTPGTVQDAVKYLPEGLPTGARVLSLEGKTVAGVLEDAISLAHAAKVGERGEALVQAAKGRWDAIVPAPGTPKVLTLEWTDPPFYGGHWVPEQVERAGGVNAFGTAGHDSGRASWDQIQVADPDVIVVMCCGYGLAENAGFARDLLAHPVASQLRAVRSGQLWAADANAYFSRPALGVVRGAELLADVLRGVAHAGESERVAG